MLTASLIGTGAIAREHLTALCGMSNVEVGAVCDLSPARAEAAAERFGVKRCYTDYRKMLAEVRADLVHIATPPASHFTIARDCLSSGFNVLCEKPITLGYDEFLELRRLAIRGGLVLMENQNLRFHSSIRRIGALVEAGAVGEVIEVQVHLSLNINAVRSRYTDRNAPHPCLGMPGGVIADFLPHIGYLAYIFTGAPFELRSAWSKRVTGSPLPADEFRALIKGPRALAAVAFSGNAQPNRFIVRVVGSRMHVEADLFEPPRLTCRRVRSGPPPLMSMVDGVAESASVLRGAVGGLWRKLGGISSYDGLPELVSRTYSALENKTGQPVSLDEIDDVARLVADFTRPEFML